MSKSSLSIAVFCSAAEGLPLEYTEAASTLGQWIARKGYRLVYGGACLGLMERVAQSAKQEGGRIIGVVPDKLVERNKVSKLLDETIYVHSLGERKEMMLKESDVFVALPGGLGTLDEVCHILGESTIGYHTKPTVLFDVNHCWDSFLQMLDDFRKRGLLRHTLEDRLLVASSLRELDLMLAELIDKNNR